MKKLLTMEKQDMKKLKLKLPLI